MQEAIELAENAVTVMTDNATDEKVLQMSKLILGEDGFDDKFRAAKGERAG